MTSTCGEKRSNNCWKPRLFSYDVTRRSPSQYMYGAMALGEVKPLIPKEPMIRGNVKLYRSDSIYEDEVFKSWLPIRHWKPSSCCAAIFVCISVGAVCQEVKLRRNWCLLFMAYEAENSGRIFHELLPCPVSANLKDVKLAPIPAVSDTLLIRW